MIKFATTIEGIVEMMNEIEATHPRAALMRVVDGEVAELGIATSIQEGDIAFAEMSRRPGKTEFWDRGEEQ